MIQIADNTMLKYLKEIWKECFHDSEEYINFFFNFCCPKKTLVYCVENLPVAMLTLFPAFYQIEKREYPIYYIYAVATKKEYQRKGYAAALLEYCKTLDRGLLLVPAMDTLFEYYKRFGFETAFYLNEYKYQEEKWEIVSAASIEEYSFTESNEEKYQHLRDQHFKGDGYIRWDSSVLNYILAENKKTGGYSWVVKHHETEDLIFFRIHQETLWVRETTISENYRKDILQELAKAFSCNQILIRSPIKWKGKGDKIPFAMSYQMPYEKEAYFNLALD